MKTQIDFLKEVKKFLMVLKQSQEKGIKILIPKQMLQRLATALALVWAGNISENLLNEMRQVIYSLYRQKEITEKVYNNIIHDFRYNNGIIQNGYYIYELKK